MHQMLQLLATRLNVVASRLILTARKEFWVTLKVTSAFIGDGDDDEDDEENN